MFGIKNARRDAGHTSQYEFSFISRVEKTLADGFAARLLKLDIACGINRLHLTWSTLIRHSWHSGFRLLTCRMRPQNDDSFVGVEHRIGAANRHCSITNRSSFRVLIMYTLGP